MKYPVASLVGFMPQGYSIPQQIEKLETCNNCGENIVAFTSWKHFEAFLGGGAIIQNHQIHHSRSVIKIPIYPPLYRHLL